MGSGGPVIYLIGTAGHPNYGDEVITAAWLRFYADRFPTSQIWLDTPRPGQSAVLHRGIHPRLHCVDTLFHACWNAPSDDAHDVLSFGARAVRHPGVIPREVTGVEVLAAADLIHVIGGGYINGIWPRHLALLSATRAVAEMTGARTAITGAGLTPPVDDAAPLVGEELAQFDVVDVRDSASLEMVAAAAPHTTNSGDDAFLAVRDLRIRAGDGPRTVLCIQEDQLAVAQTTLVDTVVNTLRSWDAATDPVLLIECLPPNDLHVADPLRQHLPQLEVLPFDQLWRDGFPVSHGQRWISTRFHPHLLAAAHGCWGVALSVGGDYYEKKHSALVRQGSGWTLTSDLVQPVPPQTAPSAPFNGRLASIQADKRAVAESVAALVVVP
jgi:polysaccharide pyruvyl transferase WcaK-like protein